MEVSPLSAGPFYVSLPIEDREVGENHVCVVYQPTGVGHHTCQIEFKFVYDGITIQSVMITVVGFGI